MPVGNSTFVSYCSHATGRGCVTYRPDDRAPNIPQAPENLKRRKDNRDMPQSFCMTITYA